MTKFYLKDGREVEIGSTIRVQNKTETPFGEGITSIDVLVTENTIPVLVEKGVLIAKNDEEIAIKSYIKRVARTHGLDFWTADGLIAAMVDCDKFAALYLLLKAASEKAMCEYNGDTCAVIHMHSGRVIITQNKNLPSHTFRFPSVEKANEAISILGSLFKEVYGNK